jgi:hypothetical protein
MPIVSIEWVALLLLILEVTGSTLGAETALAEDVVVFFSPFKKCHDSTSN